MKVHGNLKLFELASANSQRTGLRKLRENASGALRAYLDACETIVHPHTPLQVLEALSAADRVQAGEPSWGECEVLTTSSPELASAWLKARFDRLPGSSYFVSFGGGGFCTFDAKDYWIARLPVLCSSRPALAAVFDEVVHLAHNHLVVVQAGGGASLVMERYVGVVLGDLSPRELFYELAFSPC